MKKQKKPTRHERVTRLLLSRNGFTEMDGMKQLGFTSGRTDISEIEERLKVKFTRKWEANADEMGRHYRYFCPDRETAQKLVTYANFLASKREAIAYSEADAAFILSVFN